MAEYRYYLIPDFMSHVFPQQFEEQAPTEFFSNTADLMKRYKQLREMPYNNEYTWNERTNLPYPRLTVGIDRRDPDGAVTIMQVRNGINYLCDDYRGPFADRNDKQLIEMAKQLVTAVGVDRIRPHYYTEENGHTKVHVSKDIHITEWTNAPELCSALRFSRFLNRDGQQLFQVRNGQRIIENYADGSQLVKDVQTVDDTHFYVGSRFCHIQQYANQCFKRGCYVEPEHPQPGDKLDRLLIYQIPHYTCEYRFTDYDYAQNKGCPPYTYTNTSLVSADQCIPGDRYGNQYRIWGGLDQLSMELLPDTPVAFSAEDTERISLLDFCYTIYDDIQMWLIENYPESTAAKIYLESAQALLDDAVAYAKPRGYYTYIYTPARSGWQTVALIGPEISEEETEEPKPVVQEYYASWEAPAQSASGTVDLTYGITTDKIQLKTLEKADGATIEIEPITKSGTIDGGSWSISPAGVQIVTTGGHTNDDNYQNNGGAASASWSVHYTVSKTVDGRSGSVGPYTTKEAADAAANSERDSAVAAIQAEAQSAVNNAIASAQAQLASLQLERTLETVSTAIYVPFTTQELFQPGGLYEGINARSKNLILCNRKLLPAPAGMVLGMTGYGKSFSVMQMVTNIMLRWPDDDIVLIDPEQEYTHLVTAMGGVVIDISASSPSHINPMDITEDYGDDEDPIRLKSQFLQNFCQLILHSSELSPQERTFIDVAAGLTYQRYMANPKREEMPTLHDFYRNLALQGEEVKPLLTALKLYVSGSMDLFAHQTNVNVQNHCICFNTVKLGKSMQSIGMLTVLDQVWNRITRNRVLGRRTWVFTDEFQQLLGNKDCTDFYFQLSSRARKWGAILTSITQHVRSVLDNEDARRMLSDCGYIKLLNQSPDDANDLARLLHISNEEKRYIENAEVGSGLLIVSKTVVPFNNDFPKDTELFRLMDTSPNRKS